MKTAMRIMILVGFITCASCSDDLEEIEVSDLTAQNDPGDDDDVDCKGNCD